MENIKSKILCLCIAATLLLTNNACKKKEIDYTFIPEKQFTPVTVSSSPGATEAVLTWAAALNAPEGTSYTIELSKEASFGNGAEKTFTSELPTLTIKDTEIDVKVDYYARIRTNGINGALPSNWLVSSKFRIIGEQYLEAIKYEDILSNQVTIYWIVPKEITHYTVNGIKTDLSNTEIAAGKKVITGLTPATAYEIILYNGVVNKGSRTFTTKLGVPAGKIRRLASTDILRDSIESAKTQNGDVFILPQGATFTKNTNAIAIPAGVSITIFGEEGPNRPIIKLGNNFTFPVGAVGQIKFQNVILDGEGSNYVFNTTAGNVNTVQALIFENCDIINFGASILRLQGTAAKTVNNIVFDHCKVSNINVASNNYSIIDANSSTANILTIGNIEMKSSTFYNIGRGLVRFDNNTASTTLLLEDCTIYNVGNDATANGGGNRYLIDYGTAKTVTATIKNNIIAKSITATAKGVRTGISTYNALNSYKTNDYLVYADPILGIIDYTKSSTDLFTDPVNGNFKIKDTSFEGKASSGDPRWRIQ